jgi:hypothetical protein
MNISDNESSKERRERLEEEKRKAILKLEQCDEKIYNEGTEIGMIAGGNSKIIEEIVLKIKEDSFTNVDWHYVGGRARILCLGNEEEIKKAKKAFMLSRLQYLIHE